MNKKIIIFSLITLAVLAGVFLVLKNPAEAPQNLGISVYNIKSGDEISSPLKIIGNTNGNGWNGFEGQVGVVKLFDENNNQLGFAILTATEDWMQPSIDFEANLVFTAGKSGPGKLVFYNENPSGDPARDKTFELPVMIRQSTETIKVQVFFNNNKMDPEMSCNKTFAVERVVVKTQSLARTAVEELLKGPTEKEKSDGFFTSINSGVKIQKLTIENNIAKIDFDPSLEYQVGGSCRVSAIRSQIINTLKQFSSVKDIIISINGRTEDILQP